MAATRASGTNAVRYGTMRDNVLSLTAVMADGRVIRTGKRARKSSAGYDLTRLLIGSEGTLGIITSITLKLYGIPQAIAGGVCPFPSVEAACSAVIATIQMGIPVARIELVNALQMRAMIAYSKLDYPEIARACSSSSMAARRGWPSRRQSFGEIVAEFGGGPFISTSNAEERTKLWKARHDAYWASMALRPGATGLSTDVCVPISRLAECIVATEADIAEHGMTAPIVGHVGDGNFHVLVLMDRDDPASIEATEAFVGRLNMRAIAMEGTCTGEHGIGQGKIAFMEHEHRRRRRLHAHHQARARPARHPQSGQDIAGGAVGSSPPLGDARHPRGSHMTLLRGDAERRVCRAVALVSAAALDDLDDEAFAEHRRVELEELAVLVAVVEDVAGAQPVGQIRIQPEARLDVVIVVG